MSPFDQQDAGHDDTFIQSDFPRSPKYAKIVEFHHIQAVQNDIGVLYTLLQNSSNDGSIHSFEVTLNVFQRVQQNITYSSVTYVPWKDHLGPEGQTVVTNQFFKETFKQINWKLFPNLKSQLA